MQRPVRQRSSPTKWQKFSFCVATVIVEKNNDKVCLRAEM